MKNSKKVYLDSGYSSLKAHYGGKWYKLPTSIKFAPVTNINVGEDLEVFDFEGNKYLVGSETSSSGTFSTTDFSFKLNHEPLIISKFRKEVGISDDEVPEIFLSLALVDLSRQAELIERCESYVMNGKTIRNRVTIIPQGIGAFFDFVNNSNDGKVPSTTFLIDIGYNTINTLVFRDNKPIRSECKGFPNHGVTTIIAKFSAYLENTFSMSFSDQESIAIFMKGSFSMSGVVKPEVADTISRLKMEFVEELFNSILVSEKKKAAISEKVVIAGGGCYFLEDIGFPPNTFIVTKPYEYSNVRGMVILGEN